MFTRRSFLATLGALAATAACRKNGAAMSAGAGATAVARGARRLDRIGIQLYSVRTEMQRDVPATLAALAEIGYREVEFAGYFNRSPADIRALLDRNGLTAPSTHVPYERVRNELDAVLDEASAIGHRWVVVPWVGDDVRRSAATWRTLATNLNRAGERARARGIRVAYHNHDFEFTRTDGIVPFDLLLAETDPALVDIEMDVYWVTKAGGDPLAYLRQHPTRFPMLHIKDSAGAPDHRQTDVGAGTIDFAAILRLDRGQRSAIRHLFVEHDQPPQPLAFARRSFGHLKALEF